LDELQVARLEVEVESLRERLQEKDALIDKLTTLVSNLQEALVSKEAPVAYSQLVNDREDAKRPPVDPKELEAQERRVNVAREYIRMSESDKIFENPDDLKALFTPTLMEATEPGPTHANDES
jgi:hypothetical protein